MKFYTHILTGFLLAIILWNTFQVSITYAYYYASPLDFIEQFCKNIDKPELQCNGKCHLKEVATKSSTEDKAPSEYITFKDFSVFVVSNFSYQLFKIKKNNKKIFQYNNLYTFIENPSIYHPPKA